jgi:hypothetical protein
MLVSRAPPSLHLIEPPQSGALLPACMGAACAGVGSLRARTGVPRTDCISSYFIPGVPELHRDPLILMADVSSKATRLGTPARQPRLLAPRALPAPPQRRWPGPSSAGSTVLAAAAGRRRRRWRRRWGAGARGAQAARGRRMAPSLARYPFTGRPPRPALPPSISGPRCPGPAREGGGRRGPLVWLSAASNGPLPRPRSGAIGSMSCREAPPPGQAAVPPPLLFLGTGRMGFSRFFLSL